MERWRVKGTKSEPRGWAQETSTRHWAHTIDVRAALVAKGRGAIDLALGETLLELSRGERLMDLGCTRLVDYAYERLGLPKRTTFMLRKLATELATRPLLRKAVAVGAVSARQEHDAALGPLLVLVVDEKTHKEVGYTRFEDYCRDRLGMTARAARQRVWLERKMCALPELRSALKRGTITLTKALLVAKDATRSDVEARIADAASTTCQQVERESTEREDRKNRALGIRRLWGPRDAMETVAMAITTARRFSADQEEEAGAEEALEAMSELFISVWTTHLAGKSTSKSRERVIRRTNGICAVPGCQRAVEHLHHIKFRSRQGGNEEINLVSTCEPCHQ